jgi:hypothetical protein
VLLLGDELDAAPQPGPDLRRHVLLVVTSSSASAGNGAASAIGRAPRSALGDEFRVLADAG